MSSMAGGRDPRGDALLRAFARDLAKMRRDLRNLEAANQISSASIEGGALDVYDDDDVLRERIGKQANGSYGRLVLEGPIPPIPSEPDVQVISDGVVAITWDGRSEEKWPFVDFEAVRVHLVSDPVAEVCDRDNQIGAIRSARGETIVAVTESDDDNPVYVRLVAVSTAGHTSDPSTAVLVDELDEDDLDDEPEELQWEDGDGHTLTADDVTAGTVTFGLSNFPEEESILGWWHPGGPAYAGVPQKRGEAFAVDFDAPSVTWALGGFEEPGDRLRVHYPYYDLGRSVGFEADGWRYLLVAESDTTNRSAVAFDDSGWNTGRGGFGNAVAADGTLWGANSTLNWPVPSTLIPVNTGIWIRREMIEVAAAATGVTLYLRCDGDATAYWNGTQVGTRSAHGTVEVAPIDVPASLLGGSNVLAIHLVDDIGDDTFDFIYIDARIEW